MNSMNLQILINNYLKLSPNLHATQQQKCAMAER